MTMVNRYEKIILNKLLDKYENSKSFIGSNKVNQKFYVRTLSLFPHYTDHSNYEEFRSINEAIDILKRKEFIIAKADQAKLYKQIILNVDKINDAYLYIHRSNKKELNNTLNDLFEKYKDKNGILKNYCDSQIKRVKTNKPIRFYSGNLIELEKILIATDESLKVEKETFIRDFSIRVFKDSKTFERISSKVINLLFEYGDFPEKAQILNELNIVKNPTYINFKGSGKIRINEQLIDISKLRSDIAISSLMLSDIEKIEITGKAVMTIENLTSFNSFFNAEMFMIYLGGFHNSIRREFIKKVYYQNPEVCFYHFGDIDAGGFYILEHLKKQTGVNFQPYMMDIETLKKYQRYSKKLTDNDRKRLSNLKDGKYREVVKYMIDNDCKLEQEAINIDI